jgi:hypothetical protein
MADHGQIQIAQGYQIVVQSHFSGTNVGFWGKDVMVSLVP